MVRGAAARRQGGSASGSADAATAARVRRLVRLGVWRPAFGISAARPRARLGSAAPEPTENSPSSFTLSSLAALPCAEAKSSPDGVGTASTCVSWPDPLLRDRAPELSTLLRMRRRDVRGTRTTTRFRGGGVRRSRKNCVGDTDSPGAPHLFYWEAVHDGRLFRR